ncbi:ABC transporter permease [Sulfobacillus thermosulfidooxidans]|uniref:ABC transporter permease n=1 Tax=Sulfobacillus thermosulfidooxidans TaxID=28034 RepID=UPI00040168AD|nr:ABC transporter permease [Sulfobacillus thermosulfidooxidans]
MHNVRLIIIMTWKELIRRKTLPILVGMTMIFLIIFDLEIRQQPLYSVATNPLANLTTLFGDKLLAAFFINLFMTFIGIFIVAGFIANDVENGTLFVIMARPIKRWQLILGKWLAIALMEGLYLPLVVLVIQNVISSHFPGTGLSGKTMVQLLVAFLAESWIVSILALLGSIILPQVAAAITVALAFVGNFILDSIAQFSPQGTWVHRLAFLFQFLLPTDKLYQRALYEWNGGSSNPFLLASGPLGVVQPVSFGIVIYAAFYIVGALWLACMIFNRLDF